LLFLALLGAAFRAVFAFADFFAAFYFTPIPLSFPVESAPGLPGQANIQRIPAPMQVTFVRMPMHGLLIAIGAVFGVLAAACAYFIALNEYRQRMLRMDQHPRRMALQAALVTFVFILIASVVLSFVLQPAE
jgi:hypothetical protein